MMRLEAEEKKFGAVVTSAARPRLGMNTTSEGVLRGSLMLL